MANRGGAINGAADRGRMRIRAFPTAMDETYINTTMDMLKTSVREIQNKNNGGLSFEELYRNAYTMVLHKHGEYLYRELRSVVAEHLKSPRVRGQVKSSFDGTFLKTLNAAWTDHTTAMIMIRDIFMYMDRVYVEQNKQESVYNLGLSIFRDEIIGQDRVAEHLRKVLLEMIAQDRSGIAVENHQIRTACQMLMAIGEKRFVYEKEFEKPYLASTAQHYKNVSQKLLEENSASVYVSKVKECSNTELERAKRFLDAGTEVKVKEVLEEVLIREHMQTVVDMENSGLVAMMKDDKIHDLTNLYDLLRRVEGGLGVMTSKMSEYLRQIGEKLVEDGDESGERKDPVKFIADLVVLKDRFDHFLKDAFINDTNFKNKIQGDFEFFFNKNKHSPEYLSQFIDDKLKKGNKVLNDADLETLLDKAMVLFRFLSEKDVFEKYYKQHVAKRLLLEKSVSDDAEKQMITKLKTECGCQFTQKLESMFKDKEIWGTLNSSFKDAHPKLASGMDVTVRVLTQGIWPTQTTSPTGVLPQACAEAFKTFESFYLQKHNGRKIMLNTMLGSADIKATFYPHREDQSQQESEAGPSSSRSEESGGNTKILQVSTHQMVILMRFNDKERFTFDELASDTQIPERELKRSLQSLAMGKSTQRILCRKGTGKEIANEDEFFVNDNFSSKLTRIKIQTLATKADAEPERKETRNKIEEDRKHEVEAAIVRTMKARKTMSHNDLTIEVTTQLSHRFQPDVSMIKKRIESLIERDYLKRNDNDRRMYSYIA